MASALTTFLRQVGLTVKVSWKLNFLLIFYIRKQSQENLCADWLKIAFLYLDVVTEQAQAVDVMMVWAKRIYKMFSFFLSQCFLKEIENMYSVFLLSYRNTHESLGELKKAVATLACGLCFHSISRSPKLPLEFVKLDRNTVHVFYLLNNNVIYPGSSHHKRFYSVRPYM